jgi:type VI secretion system protein ImpF
MSRIDPNQALPPSLLDRLTDPESGGTAWRYGYGLEQVLERVRRDLEDLLNTRQTPIEDAERYPELQTSILAFGLPDLTSMQAITPQQRQAISLMLENIVSTFEPRLKDVRAVLMEGGDAATPNLRFRIDARLCLNPAPEVAFETTLELTTGRYSIRNAES